MKNLARLMALTLVAMLATAAFAANGTAPTTLSLHLTEKTNIAGTSLAPGDYKVYVDRNGDQASVRVQDGKKELVNTSAQFKDSGKVEGGTQLVVNKSDRRVIELRSNKLKGSLVFAGADSGTGSDGSSK